MFTNPPRILAHISSMNNGNFVTPEFILNKTESSINLFNRYCPHRMYPLSKVGSVSEENILCNFHGFEWDKNGNPLNNSKKINCGTATVGKTGLVFKNFVEPEHQWVTDLSNETSLEFSHVCQGTSSGSWLWMMEVQADLLHVRQGKDAIHPWLSTVEDLEKLGMDNGDGWVVQICSTGWWLFIYPFTFIEWSEGCLSINYTIPKDYNNEFGFDWVTQFYYDPSTPLQKRAIFEKLEDVFKEDVSAIEMQKGKYFPIIHPHNRLEDHCVHFGEWVKTHKKV